MYGTIARVKIDPAKLEDLKALGRRMGVAAGQVARYVFQMDADPTELYLIAVFENREAYWSNAQSPDQNQRYQEMRALMLADPEWHDGEIVDVVE
jgi:quinol monooxygenase YgiN